MKILKRIAVMLCALMLAVPVLAGCDSSSDISKKAQHYNIVFANATVPVNMASMDIWTSLDETYFWYGRKNTFQDTERLARRVHLVGNAGKKNSKGLPESELSAMAKKVKQLYEANDDNTFTLYCVDFGIKAAMRIFYENGIPEEQFNVILCSDGNGSYNAMRAFLNGDNQSEVLDNKIAEVDSMIRKSKKKNYKWTSSSQLDYWSETIAYATKPNVKLWLQQTPAANGGAVDANGFYTAANFAGIDAEVAARLNIEKKDLMTMANNMKAEGGNYAINSFKKSMFGDTLEDMFNGKGGKKPLIICGTSFTGEESIPFVKTAKEKTSFEVAFNKIKEVYGDEYFFIYKGHPAWPTHEGWDSSINWKLIDGVTETDFNRRIDFLDDSFDFQIDAQIPADMIMLFYADDYSLNFGGYDSSLYQQAGSDSPHNVLFFITAAPNSGISSNNTDLLASGGFAREVDGVMMNPGFLTPSTIDTFIGQVPVA